MARNPKSTAPEEVRQFLAEIGVKGGQIGGRRRAERMTPEERSAYAHKMLAARRERRAIRAFRKKKGPKSGGPGPVED